MRQSCGLIAALLLLLGCRIAAADELVGVWRLLSYTTTDPDTGEVFYPFGRNASGYIIYTAGGRMAALLQAEGRRRFSAGNRINAPAEERAEAFTASSAYTGTYTLSVDRVVHHVEVATNPDWIGSDQLRFPKVEGKRLTITTPLLPTRPDGKLRGSVLVWERVE